MKYFFLTGFLKLVTVYQNLGAAESCVPTVWNSSFYAWKWCSNKIQTNLFHTGFGRTRIIARQIAINQDVAHISSLNPAGDISTRALCGLILVGHNTYLKRSSHLTTPNHPLKATNSAKLPQWKAGARRTGVDIDHGDLRERLTYNNSSFDNWAALFEANYESVYTLMTRRSQSLLYITRFYVYGSSYPRDEKEVHTTHFSQVTPDGRHLFIRDFTFNDTTKVIQPCSVSLELSFCLEFPSLLFEKIVCIQIAIKRFSI